MRLKRIVDTVWNQNLKLFREQQQRPDKSRGLHIDSWRLIHDAILYVYLCHFQISSVVKLFTYLRMNIEYSYKRLMVSLNKVNQAREY
jgi:hypothetical protein